jgi:hypothetical protein
MNNFDYESIYATVMEGSYTNDEKEAIDVAIKNAYGNIDIILREYASEVPHSAKLAILSSARNFIHKFYENGPRNAKKGESYHCYSLNTQNKSFIFTLNQDLFFERLYDSTYLSIPGIKNDEKWFNSNFIQEINESEYYTLPDKKTLSLMKPHLLNNSEFFLIKLHGSCNWKNYVGTQQMVIGRGKNEKIQKEPLLRCYFDIFEEVLSQSQRQLLVIGYGFGDTHINSLLAKSVNNHGLKIYVISPKSPEDFKNKLLKNKKHGENIWQGLSGYFPYRFRDIFPINSEETQISRKLFELYFDET